MAIRDFIVEDEKVDESIGSLWESMTGAEIAKELGITRQAVSNTLKRAMKKMFIAMKKENPDMSDFDVAVSLQIGLGVDDVDVKKFFKLFPPDVRKKIEASAKSMMPGQKKK